AAGFRSRQRRSREPTPATSQYALFASYKAARVHRAGLLGLIGWADPDGTSGCADEVTLSLKGANSPTRGPKPRSTRAKWKSRAARGRGAELHLIAKLFGRAGERRRDSKPNLIIGHPADGRGTLGCAPNRCES